ncbi:hypothetical protein AeMF1_019014 [Aphanomyces euteiches]|nr:hypothetical protein AeMF1_019014 [Aphanomyces euteiches]
MLGDNNKDNIDSRLQPFCIRHGAQLHLKLSSIELTDDLLECVLRAVQIHSNITSLSLLNLGGGPKMAVVLADMLEHNTSLTSCDLSGNAIGSHGSKCLSHSLFYNHTLQSLSLRKCSLGTDGIADWVSFIQHGRNSTLDTLNLSYNRIDDEGAELLATALQQLKFKPSPTRRWRLNLLGNPISDIGLDAIATMMRFNTFIITLDIANSKSYALTKPERGAFVEHCARRNTRNVAAVDVHAAIEAIGLSLRRAENTRLAHVPLTEVDCVKLSHALSRSKATTHLYLRHNTMSLAGLTLLSSSLSTCRSLYSLTLVDNDVGGDGVMALLKAIDGFDVEAASPLRELHIINSKAMQPTWPRRCVAPIYRCLVQGSLLTAITLANCGLDDATTPAIVAGLAWGCRLESVNLARNGFTDKSIPVFQVLLRRSSRLAELNVGGNQCTLTGLSTLAQWTNDHKALRRLKLGRVARLDDALLSIEKCISSNDRLVELELGAAHEHSKYRPIMQAIQSKIAANRTLQGTQQAAEAPTMPTTVRDHHVLQCRLQYVAREVARDSVAWWIHPRSVVYLVEQRFMALEDVNASELVEAMAMQSEDINASVVIAQATESLAMAANDTDVLKLEEYMHMTMEDILRWR